MKRRLGQIMIFLVPAVIIFGFIYAGIGESQSNAAMKTYFQTKGERVTNIEQIRDNNGYPYIVTTQKAQYYVRANKGQVESVRELGEELKK